MKKTYRNKRFLELKKDSKITECEIYYCNKYNKEQLKRLPTIIRIDKNVTSVNPYKLTDDYNMRFVHDFKVDKDNDYFCDVNGVLFTKDKKKLIAFPPGRVGDKYCLPRGTLIIGENAFTDSHITEIVISKSLKILEKDAFYASYSYLVDFSKSSVKKISSGCFKECDIYIVRNNKFSMEDTFAQNWRGTRFITPDKKEELLKLIFDGTFHEISYWKRYD